MGLVVHERQYRSRFAGIRFAESALSLQESDLIVHSDRGSQYASSLHPSLLVKHGLVGIMSRKGNCGAEFGFCHNTVMERFFLSLKIERVLQKDYANHAEAITGIAEYKVNLYIAVRLHSTLKGLSTIAIEHQTAMNQHIELRKLCITH